MDLIEMARERTEARRIVRDTATFLEATANTMPAQSLIDSQKRTAAALRLVVSLSLGSDAETHQIMLTALEGVEKWYSEWCTRDAEDWPDVTPLEDVPAAIARGKGIA